MSIGTKVETVKDQLKEKLSIVFNSRSKEAVRDGIKGASIGLQVAAIATIFGVVAAAPGVLLAGAGLGAVAAAGVAYQTFKKTVKAPSPAAAAGVE